MTEESRLLFVYGTLRRDGHQPMAALLREHTSYLGPARVAGQLFDTGRYPAAAPSRDEGSWVHGELYELDDPNEVWLWLDEYEGYFPGNEGDSLFVRRLQPVTPDHGPARYAWMYWYNRPVDAFTRIEGGRYGQDGVSPR